MAEVTAGSLAAALSRVHVAIRLPGAPDPVQGPLAWPETLALMLLDDIAGQEGGQ
jgi:hypothetical protein